MEEKTIVTLSKNDVEDAIIQYLQKANYKVIDLSVSISMEQRTFKNVKAEVEKVEVTYK